MKSSFLVLLSGLTLVACQRLNPAYEADVADTEATFGPTDPDTLAFTDSYANILSRLGRHDEADAGRGEFDDDAAHGRSDDGARQCILTRGQRAAQAVQAGARLH